MIVSITDAFGLIINKKMLYEVKKLSGGRVDAEALEFSNSLSQWWVKYSHRSFEDTIQHPIFKTIFKVFTSNSTPKREIMRD